MRNTRYAVLALIGAALLMSGCNQDQVAEKHRPAKLDSTDVKGIMRVTLESRAAERLGITTSTVKDVVVQGSGRTATRIRKVLPYAALMYDTKGDTWMFTNPEPLVYVRQQVVVEDIEGDQVFLSAGPPAGTAVVTVGAAELMGAEHKYGY